MSEPDRLPTPEDLGESPDHPSATHGEFHHRPGFEPGLGVLYCPCDDPLDNPDSDCPVHGGA